MHAIEIIPTVSMRNPELDAYCSLYGSIPPGFTEEVTRGWTIAYIDAHGRQVIGNGSTPYKTEQEAIDAANACNDRRRRQLQEHAAAYPEQESACRAMAENLPHFELAAVTA